MNRLAHEISPYLLQHSNNPVDWYPWSDEAFSKAENENKPIFLSIGYSTCHWCHVMEKESFEDLTVANFLNNNFVSIKVDREERPELDNIYMMACQLMNGNGGWPLTAFLTPQKEPFFIGTYFPKENRLGRIGLYDLLNNIDNAWRNKKEDIINHSNNIVQSLQSMYNTTEVAILEEDIFMKAYKYFENNFDESFGGFGNAPKFPSPHNLIFLLRYSHKFNASKALEMVTKTLIEMRNGGIFDQIGYGFHRYSTDRKWFLPHFEKMIYDQALLIILYSEAYQATKNELFKSTAYEIIEYCTTQMYDILGGFYSAEDADSEGIEGKFYLWSYSELSDILDETKLSIAKSIWGIEKEGNLLIEDNFTSNLLANKLSIKEVANNLNLTEVHVKNELLTIKELLLTNRNKKIHPFKDDKILTDWNGLMIAALAFAGKVFANRYFIEVAQHTSDFIFTSLVNDDNSLNHLFRNGISSQAGTIDDYAFFSWGLIELYNATLKIDYLIKAKAIIDKSIYLFYDEKGGFYFSKINNNDLILRTKEIYDGAIPSGNSVLMSNMIFVNSITNSTLYNNYIDKSFDFYSSTLSKLPFSSTFLLSGYLKYYYGYQTLVILFMDDIDLSKITEKINSIYLPLVSLVFIKVGTQDSNFENYTVINERTTFYLCKNFNCLSPTNDFDKILKELQNNILI